MNNENDARQGAPGTIDTRFGENGFASIRGPDGNLIVPTAIATDASDRIWAANLHTVFRLFPDGSLDRDFGDNGFCNIALVGSSPYSSVSVVIRLLDDGSAMVVGQVKAFIEGTEYLVPAACRVLPDGVVDRSFGENGMGTYRPPLSRHLPRQNDLGVAYACTVGTTFAPTAYVFLVKITREGQTDATFGNGGFVELRYLKSLSVSRIPAFVDTQGRVLVGGMSPSYVAVLARHLPDGRLDPTFGAGGLVEFPHPGSLASTVESLALVEGGKILVAIRNGLSDRTDITGLAKLNEDGSPDQAFNGGETVYLNVRTTPVLPDTYKPRAVVARDNGRPVVGGVRYVWPDNKRRTAGVTRLLPDGGVDTNFGVNGTTAIHDPDGVWDMALQGMADIIVLGDYLYEGAGKITRLLG